MHPVQRFKINFDQLTQTEPIFHPVDNVVDHIQHHEADSHVRNICFVWPDGRRFFLNYAYLVASEFSPTSDKNLITLNFSAYNVALHGYGLETLFMNLLDHLPRVIMATDLRYALGEDRQRSVIVQMTVVKIVD